jgi:GNAT superfamily N-acetyltransferase
MDDWRIEPLSKAHLRGEFCCGKAPLDEFIRSLVSQYEKRKLGRTFVAVRPEEKRVYGYYTLASGSVPCQHLPAAIARKLPKHPVPVALLGRLAVDQTAQGRGMGADLLMDALHRCLALSAQLGLYAVEVLAIDDAARQFYLKYGFVPLVDNEMHLFLPMSVIEAELGKDSSDGSGER